MAAFVCTDPQLWVYTTDFLLWKRLKPDRSSSLTKGIEPCIKNKHISQTTSNLMFDDEPCDHAYPQTPPMCKFPENWFHRVTCTLISEICLKQLEHMLGNVCFEQTSLGFIIAFVFWLVFLSASWLFLGGKKALLWLVYTLHANMSMYAFESFDYVVTIINMRRYPKQKKKKEVWKRCNLEWTKFDSLWFARLCLWE